MPVKLLEHCLRLLGVWLMPAGTSSILWKFHSWFISHRIFCAVTPDSFCLASLAARDCEWACSAASWRQLNFHSWIPSHPLGHPWYPSKCPPGVQVSSMYLHGFALTIFLRSLRWCGCWWLSGSAWLGMHRQPDALERAVAENPEPITAQALPSGAMWPLRTSPK